MNLASLAINIVFDYDLAGVDPTLLPLGSDRNGDTLISNGDGSRRHLLEVAACAFSDLSDTRLNASVEIVSRNKLVFEMIANNVCMVFSCIEGCFFVYDQMNPAYDD